MKRLPRHPSACGHGSSPPDFPGPLAGPPPLLQIPRWVALGKVAQNLWAERHWVCGPRQQEVDMCRSRTRRGVLAPWISWFPCWVRSELEHLLLLWGPECSSSQDGELTVWMQSEFGLYTDLLSTVNVFMSFDTIFLWRTSIIHCLSDRCQNFILPLDWLLRTERRMQRTCLHHLQEKNCALAWVSLCLHRLNRFWFFLPQTQHRPALYRAASFPGGRSCFCAVQSWHSLSFSISWVHGSPFGEPCPIQLPISLNLLRQRLSFVSSLGCQTLWLPPDWFSKL